MNRLENFHLEVSDALDRIAKYLKPGAKTTFIARFPGFPERDILITDDSPEELAQLIQRRSEAAAKQ